VQRWIARPGQCGCSATNYPVSRHDGEHGSPQVTSDEAGDEPRPARGALLCGQPQIQHDPLGVAPDAQRHQRRHAIPPTADVSHRGVRVRFANSFTEVGRRDTVSGQSMGRHDQHDTDYQLGAIELCRLAFAAATHEAAAMRGRLTQQGKRRSKSRTQTTQLTAGAPTPGFRFPRIPAQPAASLVGPDPLCILTCQ
jgi:hypothetical protein